MKHVVCSQMNKIIKQECIPVGCLPAAHWPYAGVCFPGGVRSRGAGCPNMHWDRKPPPPPWTESQTPVKTLPWPNFVAAGNNKYPYYKPAHDIFDMELNVNLLQKFASVRGRCVDNRLNLIPGKYKYYVGSIIHFNRVLWSCTSCLSDNSYAM